MDENIVVSNYLKVPNPIYEFQIKFEISVHFNSIQTFKLFLGENI